MYVRHKELMYARALAHSYLHMHTRTHTSIGKHMNAHPRTQIPHHAACQLIFIKRRCICTHMCECVHMDAYAHNI